MFKVQMCLSNLPSDGGIIKSSVIARNVSDLVANHFNLTPKFGEILLTKDWDDSNISIIPHFILEEEVNNLESNDHIKAYQDSIIRNIKMNPNSESITYMADSANCNPLVLIMTAIANNRDIVIQIVPVDIDTPMSVFLEH